ncbi:AAA family ATPase [Nocardioides sp. B-3]|uniref:AAA family ATPase n=1 Tax=Nocardioides sp. B-3 TaxID=2895565 RepID=UPI00300DED0D
MQRANTVISLDLPAQRQIVAADPDYVVRSAVPVFIDEWQLHPPVWDRVCRAVDEDAGGGRFLLAGSAAVAPEARVHSGAGRIVSLTMRPLSFAERGPGESTVSLAELLTGSRPAIEGRSDIGPVDYVDEIPASGFPGIRGLPERARNAQLDSYLTRIVDRDLPENGLNVRRPAAVRASARRLCRRDVHRRGVHEGPRCGDRRSRRQAVPPDCRQLSRASQADLRARSGRGPGADVQPRSSG